MTTFAIVTHCRDRIDALRQTLPAFVAQRLPYDHFAGVVVVDNNSTGNSVSEIVELYGALAVRLESESYLPCRCRNAGILAAINKLKADYVFFASCDMLPNADDSLAQYAALANDGAVLYPLSLDPPGWCETALLNADTFRAIHGYDESHTGYGHDDSNFYLRLQHHRFATTYGPNCFTHIDHARPEIDPAELSRNWNWAADMSRPCNPRGYGR